MAKTKKNIDAFQNALRSNTRNFSSDEAKAEKQPEKKSNSGKDKKLDESIEKLNKLAQKHNVDPEELHTFALEFFLKFEDEFFKD